MLAIRAAPSLDQCSLWALPHTASFSLWGAEVLRRRSRKAASVLSGVSSSPPRGAADARAAVLPKGKTGRPALPHQQQRRTQSPSRLYGTSMAIYRSYLPQGPWVKSGWARRKSATTVSAPKDAVICDARYTYMFYMRRSKMAIEGFA